MHTPIIDDAGSPSGPPVPALPPEATLGHLLRRAQQVHTAIWSDELHGDLTSPQYAVLSALSHSSGVDQRTAGTLASLDKSTTAGIVARLQRDGWIRRARDTADGRRNLLFLTTAAKTALHDITRRTERVQERLLEPLGPNLRRTCVKLLAQVAYRGDVPDPAGDRDIEAHVLRLSTTPGHLLRRAEQVHGACWSQRVGDRLTPTQYVLLCCLAWRVSMSQNAVSDMASLDTSSTADIVARLRRRQWIQDTRDTTDRRRKLLTLTPAAVTVLSEVTPAVQAVQDDLARPLSPAERDRLVSILRRIAYR